METKEESFKDTPQDNARRWSMELKAAKEKLSGWYTDANDADDALTMKKGSEGDLAKRLSFYPANIHMQLATMYGRPPQVTSTRRFGDADDDVARVAAEIQERLLNTDIERDSDSSAEAFGNSLLDSLETDFACVRLSYVFETEDTKGKEAIVKDGKELAPAVPPVKRKKNENVNVDYVHWRDMLWGPSRVWSDVPWVAFLIPMSKKQVTKDFGEDVAAKIPYNSRRPQGSDPKNAHPWDRADVWNIWEKDGKRVFYLVEGYDSVLVPASHEGKADEGGGIPDPLGLEGFWPCPRPIILNATTTALVPKPDYVFAKDVYNSINTLYSRKRLLIDALKVVGVADKSAAAEIKAALDSAENQVVPVDNWAMFAEKGGLKGIVDWFPVEQVANTLAQVNQTLREEEDLLFQLTGRSDLERGQATQAGATATEQRAKVKYGSVRMQRRQDRFAEFVSEAMRKKAEIISKHFETQTILERCNCQYTSDKDIAPRAVELLKSQAWQFRIEVKPEQLALQDFGAAKEEGIEVLNAIGGFTVAIGQAVEKLGPDALPVFFEMLKVTLARLKGGGAYESILDKAIQRVEQRMAEAAANPQPAPPDPKVQAQQMKMQGDQIKAQMDHQKEVLKSDLKLRELSAEVQAKGQMEVQQRQENVREAAEKQMVTNALKPKEPAHAKT